MSGGSLDYVYSKVEDAAHSVIARATTPLHRAFGAHLLKVSEALHDLEWVLSCDYGPGDEVAAIKAVVSPQAEIEAATERANEALHELQAVLSSNAISHRSAACGASGGLPGCAANGDTE